MLTELENNKQISEQHLHDFEYGEVSIRIINVVQLCKLLQIWKIGKGIDQLKEWFRKEENNKNRIIHNILILLSYLRLMIFQIIALHIGTCLYLYSSVQI